MKKFNKKDIKAILQKKKTREINRFSNLQKEIVD